MAHQAGTVAANAAYPESKERSAELLRLALTRMGACDAAFNPITFAVWYEHLAGTNPSLSRAFEEARARDPRLGDPAIVQLYETHVAGLRDLYRARAATDLDQLMASMAGAADATGGEAGRFHATLSQLAQTLRTEDAPELRSQTEDAHAHTERMTETLSTLREQLARSREEIGRLRTELRSARTEAATCPLTGVLNRKGFDLKLADMMGQPSAAMRSHCLVMLDIDHFKVINDQHGHLFGDRVLQAVGAILREAVRAPGSTQARYGGEEFAILLPDSSLDQAAVVAEDVRQALRRMKVRRRQTDQEVMKVTLSAGVTALVPGEDANAFIARADAALYRAKDAGRDRVIVEGR